ncbi:MAG: glycosyltransferase family 39 protein [Candidatus Bathyarchaeota archaeon]|nr:glycosyltransferase family 39 protein [Candidatus Bathyarchaeota archaeon]
MSTFASISDMSKEKKIEVAFITIFSLLIFAIFYTLISMNGVVLGNDPAVHLEKAQIFLNTGKIPLVNLGWTPPLYEIVLAMFISLSGAADIGQFIFLVKFSAVIVDWLLFLSVYLLASKFFNKKVGAVAAVLLLMCFPMYEVNQFGGYTTVLALAFMFLVFLYTPLAIERFGYLVVTFLVAFGVVLSHQLAAFLTIFIMPPVLIFMLIKSKGAYLKVVMALILGGGIAFFLYYFQAMIGYLDLVIEYVFFAVKTYAYQIPSASFNAFMINFGFIFFFALAGIFVSYYILKKQKKMIFFVTLMLSFFVPFFFAESYLIGFYMPFSWFIYYLAPFMVVLAAVSIVFLADKSSVFYVKNKAMFRKNWLKITTVSIIILLSLMLVYRSDIVYGKIMEASVYYSTTDIKAYDAGVWLNANYPGNSKVVATEIPGFWFQEFSGKSVIAQTDPTVQRNEIAESVLSLSYEIEHPQTLIRAYEAEGDIADETYVSFDQVWNRVSFSSGTGDFLSYTVNGIDYKLALSSLSKQIFFDEQSSPKKIEFIYSNDYAALTKTVTVENTSYPLNVSWTLTPLKHEISNATLYLSTFFDLKYDFDKAQIPQLLDWVNPWDAPSPIKTVHGTDWAVASFANTNLKDNYIGLYDDTNGLAFAFKFNDLPDWGNIGALEKRQIDAVRFQYQFNDLNVNQTASRSYQVLTMSKNSFPTLQPDVLQGLFNFKTAEFTVSARDYTDYIKENNIGFIVYDRNHLDTQMIHSKLLQLIYSNDRYVIFKILK